ncbi:outer membrane beta-barrel protein [Kordiimonas aestuarii]|uniref:outer membrane beta-barrel protein n=1 Tax=Kordiimonas aestuarii TaxID=1005925 RepID=UPI0021D0ED8B|nr:outer membrane beta-barrel protein [Kordiimonas aestuarii]
MKNQKTMIVASILMGGTALAPAAFAQDATAEGDAVRSVYERYRPDYDAPGVRSGSFLFYPSATVAGKYSSNIYAEESGVTDDFIVNVKPSFNLVSDWNTSYFSLSAKADIGRYVDNGSEDYEDYGLSMNGRKDISYGTDLHASVSYDQLHEDRGSADSPGAAAEQTKYSVFKAGAGFKRDVSVMSLAVDGEFAKRDYDDSAVFGGGTPINNDDRDRDRWTGKARVGYEMANGYEAFVRVVGDRVEYDNSKEDGGPNRNSDGYEAVAGAAFDLTGKSKGEFYVGYMKRSYDSDTIGSIDGLNYGADLLWNVTGLTSFRATVKRSIEETTVGGLNGNGVPTLASGVVTSLYSGRVEHELRRNLLLNGVLSYTTQDYRRTVREDDIIGAKLGMKYLLNPNFNVNAGYNYDYRSTNQQGQDYQRHSFMVGVTGQW